jgi:hypothetical protein
MAIQAIVAASSGDNTVVAAVTGKKVRVSHYEISASAAVNVKWRSGTTDLTGLFYLAAAGATADADATDTRDGDEFLFETVAGQALVLNLSARGRGRRLRRLFARVTGDRRTQPYRAGARMPGPALDAMKRGRSAGGLNPADTKRAGYLIAAGKRTQRPNR